MIPKVVKTNRSNAYATLSTKIGSNGLVKNQLYFVNYGFSLFSNFTFFLEDSVHGDGINQRDQRNIYGYNGTYEQAIKLGKVNLRMLYGATARVDEADLVLQRQERRTLRDIITAGHLNQENVAFFTEQTLELDSKFSIIAGLRFDYFNFKFKHISDEALSGDKAKNITSPKLSFLYDIANNVQLYLKGGIGFHSNDARDVVRAKSTDNVLPKAYSAELGSTFKIGKKALANIALYRIDLESELVYVGDAGEVEAKGATERYGIDVAIRYQLLGKLFLDVNGNYAKGKFKDLPNGENNIPLAPRLSSTGGISYKQDRGFNAAIRYRYIADRPANEINSVIAKGYFLLDAVANYSWAKTTLGLSVENVLNVKWNQAQFDTESRLRGENVPVSELHFTPGTPFFAKLSFVILW